MSEGIVLAVGYEMKERIVKTQRIQLDVSSDIVDKVMFFLKNLPKDKVRVKFDTFSKTAKDKTIFSKTAGLLSSQGIDPVVWQNKIRKEWDRE